MDLEFTQREKEVIKNLLLNRIAHYRQYGDLSNKYIVKDIERYEEFIHKLGEANPFIKTTPDIRKSIRSVSNKELDKYNELRIQFVSIKNPMKAFEIINTHSSEISNIEILHSILHKTGSKKKFTFITKFLTFCKQIQECSFVGIELDDYLPDRIENLVFFKDRSKEMFLLNITQEFSNGSFKFKNMEHKYIEGRKKQSAHYCSQEEVLGVINNYPKTQFYDGMQEFINVLLEPNMCVKG